MARMQVLNVILNAALLVSLVAVLGSAVATPMPQLTQMVEGGSGSDGGSGGASSGVFEDMVAIHTLKRVTLKNN